MLALGALPPGELVPLGPDAADWLAELRRLQDAPWLGADNRFPLVPALAAMVAPLMGGLAALDGISLLSTAVLALVIAALGSRLAGPRQGILAGAVVAVLPLAVEMGLSPSAYGFFSLAFTLLVAALLGLGGIGLAGGAAFLAAATLQQGLLCVLALLPVGLLARRPRSVGAAAVGALVAAGGIRILRPELREPLGWMLQETARYLGGNIGEETARAGMGWGETWWAWARDGLGGAPLLLVLVGAATVGIIRERRLALGVALVPLVILVPAMASPHHLLHLLPLLVLAAIGAPRTERGRAALAALLMLACVGGGIAMQPGREAAVRRARGEAAAVRGLVDALPEGPILLAPAGGRTRLTWGAWAAPLGRPVVDLGELRPAQQARLVSAIGEGRAWLVGGAPEEIRLGQDHGLEVVGEQVAVSGELCWPVRVQ